MVGWHHQINGHELEQAPGNSEGRGSLACCSPCSHRELDTTQRPNNNKITTDVTRYGGPDLGEKKRKAQGEVSDIWQRFSS